LHPAAQAQLRYKYGLQAAMQDFPTLPSLQWLRDADVTYIDIWLRKDFTEEVLDDIEVRHIESTNDPEGSLEAFNTLKSRLPKSRLPHLKGRKLYRIFQYPDGPYCACIAIKNADDLKALGHDTSTVRHGKHARRKLKNWTKRKWEIPDTFAYPPHDSWLGGMEEGRWARPFADVVG
jgi:hypothetical protein